MQFLFLIIINVIMAAVFYLIITLKLEKSASQFKEQKLRREMDEIIKEFNAAAERNISLLENKIAVLKKLLETTGNKKTFDYLLGDGHAQKSGLGSGKDNTDFFFSNEKNGRDTDMAETHAKNDDSIWSKFKKNMQEHLEKYKNKLAAHDTVTEPVSSAAIDSDRVYPHKKEMVAEKRVSKGNTIDITIEKDLSNLKLDNSVDTVQNSHSPNGSEDEIHNIMENSDDRFAMISSLHDRGYTVEVISRYSGIPEGEVKLVLNLSK